ncbi:MAG: amidohydrolase [Rhodospirillales bacterium]|nr:amidohydrolase [Rhodospirillales bacterium]MDH3920015.1 amidohydrolase [Rhodospirillales bacterium]
MALLVPAGARAGELPLVDAHIHYSHDAWETLPPEQAVGLLRAAGLKQAFVSSSSDEGTQKLHAVAPDLVVPVLRPYRRRGEISTWMRDETVVAHVEARLAKHRYAGIGEFHVHGAEADLPVVRRLVELAKAGGLFLHVHSDAEAIQRIFAQDPDARVLWAHAGFENAETIRALLESYRTLWADLAFRSDHAAGGEGDPAWRALFSDFAERFLVGTDTYTPERWHEVAAHASWTRDWLSTLPAEVAEKIAHRNAEALARWPGAE